MGKASRRRNKDRRDAEKRSRRESNKRHWQELAARGMNGKSKRFIKARRKKASLDAVNKNHSDGPCGNLACQKCHPGYPPYRTKVQNLNVYVGPLRQVA